MKNKKIIKIKDKSISVEDKNFITVYTFETHRDLIEFSKTYFIELSISECGKFLSKMENNDSDRDIKYLDRIDKLKEKIMDALYKVEGTKKIVKIKPYKIIGV